MSLEDELRTTLRDRAAESVPQPDLLTSVAAGVRRDRHRRTVVSVAAAALTLVAAAAVPVALSRDSPAPPATPPTATLAPAPATHGSWAPKPFPLKPSWVPADAGRRTVLRLGPNMQLEYSGDRADLIAEVGPIEPAWEVEGEEDHPGTVGRRRATVRTADSYDGGSPGDRFVGVRWRLDDGRWAQVLSFGQRTEREVLRFAEGLGEGSVPAGPAPFTFAVVPRGLALEHQGESSMCMAPPSTANGTREPSGLCVTLTGEPPEESESGEKLRIGGRAATYDPEGTSLDIDLDGKRFLNVYWDRDVVPLSRDELIGFAEGIRVRR